MISVRRSKDRRHDRSGKREVWLTFNPQDRADLFAAGFGTVEFLDEDLLKPGAAVTLCPDRDAEIFTYVHQGELATQDSEGHRGVLLAGEFQRRTAGRGARHRECNASLTKEAHVFRIWLHPREAGREPGCEQRRFTAAETRGKLCVVASPDARHGSLRIHQDVLIHAALLEPGHHVVHILPPGRSAWVHVVQGEVTLGDIALTTGDGAALTGERAASLTARERSWILLLDVGEPLPGLTRLSNAEFFKMLWCELVELLGTAATAAIIRRAVHRALPRNQELGELTIARVDGEYRYSLPRSFDGVDGPTLPLCDLLDELRPLLQELTGKLVLRRFKRVPQLRAWADIA
jgi:hypothetical protein